MSRPEKPGKPRVLFVDDEVDLAEGLGDYLDLRGFECRTANSARQMREVLTVWIPDVIVLDVHLGKGEDGFSLAAWLGLRFTGAEAPLLLFLSGGAGPVERVLGLELGADDFLAKPIVPRELLARITSLMQRQGRRLPSRKLVRIGNVGVDRDRQSLIGADGSETVLAPGEFALLKCFLDEPDRVFTREDLLDRAPASDEDVADRAIDRRINRLRQKLDRDSDGAILAIRGQGYRLGYPIRQVD